MDHPVYITSLTDDVWYLRCAVTYNVYSLCVARSTRECALLGSRCALMEWNYAVNGFTSSALRGYFILGKWT